MLDAKSSRRGLSTIFHAVPRTRTGGTEHLRRPVVVPGRLTPATLSPTAFRSRLSCHGQVRTSMPDFESPCARVERSSEDSSSIRRRSIACGWAAPFAPRSEHECGRLEFDSVIIRIVGHVQARAATLDPGEYVCSPCDQGQRGDATWKLQGCDQAVKAARQARAYG